MIQSHLYQLGNASLGKSCDDPTYILFKKLFYFVPLIYGIPTVFLYICIVTVILRSPRQSIFKLAFYKIYVTASIITVVMWCWDMTTTRFIAIGFWCQEMLYILGSPSYVLTPVQFIMTYSRHAQFYVATVLSINRMTAVVYPAKYSKIWGTHLFPILLSIFLLPLLSSWYLLPTQTLLAHYPMGGLTLTYIKMLDNPWNSVTYMTMVVGSLCGVLIFISTIVTYSKLNNISRREHGRTIKTEHSLLIVGLVSSTTTFCLAIVELPFYILCNFFMDTYLFFLATCIKQLLIDIMFVFCPWSMFFVCTGIRKAILDMFKPVPSTPQKQLAGRLSTISNIL